jgi:acylphosphatase
MNKSYHARITGRVQGVGYRAWTVATASKFGLSGWVRNRKDGSVEALFYGTQAQLDDMVKACRKGPLLAKVEHIDLVESQETPAEERFEHRPTE